MGDENDLVQVAYVVDSGEAAIVQGVLESRGIRSMVRSTGVEGPAAGLGLASLRGRAVLVLAADEDEAREAIAEAIESPPGEEPGDS
jgi:hypothetical protein